MTDKINPDHYRSHPSGVECIAVTRHMGFNLGNVVKYLWRAGLKENAPTLEDLKKARWYLDDEIKKLEGGYLAKYRHKVVCSCGWAGTPAEFGAVGLQIVCPSCNAPINSKWP